MATVDPGFAQGIRRHVEEDGALVVAVAKSGDPALWDSMSRNPAVQALRMNGKLREARDRSKEQARALLMAGTEVALDTAEGQGRR